jgi:hypothetical protein
MIVKLQRPLGSNESQPPCLIYDLTRRQRWFLDLSPQEVQALLGDDAKGYFECEVTDGKPVLGQRVADQPW